jgi:hypothetical protein
MSKDQGKLMTDTKLVTPIFRVSFPKLFKAESFQGAPPKYSVVMLFDPETADLVNMKKAAEAAAQDKWGAKRPGNLWSPFREGDKDRPDTPGYTGMIYVTASTKEDVGRPAIVDQKKNPITDASGMYAGCYAKAIVNAFAFDIPAKRGVSFGLNAIQFVRDGEAFGGFTGNTDAFDELEVDSVDASDGGW